MHRDVPTTPWLAFVSRRLARLPFGGPTGLACGLAGVACAVGLLVAGPHLALPPFDGPGGWSLGDVSRAETASVPRSQRTLKPRSTAAGTETTEGIEAVSNGPKGPAPQHAVAPGGSPERDAKGGSGTPNVDEPAEPPNETPGPPPTDRPDGDTAGHHETDGEPEDGDAREREAGADLHDSDRHDRSHHEADHDGEHPESRMDGVH